MPRVTRRSLAAAEEKTETPDPPPTKSRGRRGAKPAETEDAGSVDEPQEIPVKGRKGGRAKEVTPKVEAPRGRGSSRSAARGRGRVNKEPAVEDSEEDVEEPEVKVTPKKSSRGRGRGRGRSSARSSRGKATVEDEEEEEMDDEISKPVEEPKPSSESRGRGRSKAVEEQPAENVEHQETKSTPRGRSRKTPIKTEPESTPPSSSKRRSGRSQAAEVVAPAKVEEKISPAKLVPSEETKPEETTSSAALSEKTEKQHEDMEAEDDQAEEQKSQEAHKTDEAQAMKVETHGQKRKHEDKDVAEDNQSKRTKLSDSTPASSTSETPKDEAREEFADYVMISTKDVPAADSKEIADALLPMKKVEESKEKKAVEESKIEQPESSAGKAEGSQGEQQQKEESMETESIQAKQADTSAEMEIKEAAAPQIPAVEAAIPQIPAVVPLTEAELGKQRNPTMRDRDEMSSTLVEVGSEAPSDVTSVKNLDVSDATSMDVTTSEQANEETNVSLATDSSAMPKETSNNSLFDIPLPPASNDVTPSPVLNSTIPKQAASGVPLNSIPLPVAPSSTPSPVAPQSATNTNATQNGSVQSSDPIQPAPLLTSTPLKQPNLASLEGYVPSSTVIDKRKFIMNPNFPIELFDTAFCFSVVSYNVLAECHLTRNNYSYTEPQYLEQSYRHNLMTKELEYLDGDIVCMQEVSPAYYNDTLSPFMKSKGYQGLHMKRTQEWYNEGEATFVKDNKFEILSHQSLSLKDLAYKEIDLGGLSEEVARAAKKYLDRPDVVVLCKLLSKKTGKTLTVCNIHVVWDMASPDVQCIQVACAIKELVTMAGSDLNPYIICGDFNSEVTSPAYHLAKEGYLSDAHIRSLQALEKMDNTDGSSCSLINHLWRAFQHTSSNLKSAYETAMGKEPMLTSYNRVMHAAPDYIFYSSSSLYTVGALETIDPQVMESTGGIPSKIIPSDHVSLKAVFRLKD